MKKIILWIFIFGFVSASAQDTLSVLQYNLLNYGNYTSYCTETNNNYSTKDNYIKTIVHYVKPDIFSVNEISGSAEIHKHLLDYALNTDGTDYFSMAPSISSDNDYLVNMLYYNHDKLGLASHVIAQSYVRDVDLYKLYYKSARLSSGDTTFLYCVVAHLKAGRSDTIKRKEMAKNTMDYIETHHPDNNYLLMGDFNVYSDEEPAFQEFINYSDANIRFNDPAEKIGYWHNNADYSMVHSQSTHTNNGCASSGGMDDRFDFILISNNIKNKQKRVGYLQGSYKVVGQDGNHFNKALIDPPADTSVPSNVLNALYNNSDHLPVNLKLIVDEPVGVTQFANPAFEMIRFPNPVSGDRLNIHLNVSINTKATIEIYSLLGKRVLKQQAKLQNGQNQLNIDISSLNKGMYIIRFTDANGLSQSRKLIKR